MILLTSMLSYLVRWSIYRSQLQIQVLLFMVCSFIPSLSILVLFLSSKSQIEIFRRKFIWRGDINSRKMVVVAWHHGNQPLDEGGLNIGSLARINKTYNLKLCWEFLKSDITWAKTLRQLVLRKENPIAYHVFSSMWSGIKVLLLTAQENLGQDIGDDIRINFWTNDQLGVLLVQYVNILEAYYHVLIDKVNMYLVKSIWILLNDLIGENSTLPHILNQVTISCPLSPNLRVWLQTKNGDLTFEDSFIFQKLLANRLLRL